MNKDVLLLITGGTIDKVHDPATEDLVFEDTLMPELLAKSRAQGFVTKTLFLKDSLDMEDADRDVIKEAIKDASQISSIVITHGTSTMVKTAQYLEEHLHSLTQTIVLTGAFRPYSLQSSDAQFNVGAAFMAARILDAGIYIGMHGVCYKPNEVVKNTEELKFVEKNREGSVG